LSVSQLGLQRKSRPSWRWSKERVSLQKKKKNKLQEFTNWVVITRRKKQKNRKCITVGVRGKKIRRRYRWGGGLRAEHSRQTDINGG